MKKKSSPLPPPLQPSSEDFVRWFRSVAPYVHAFRGRTFVVAFGGEVVADGRFLQRIHDLALLAALGVRLVLVHGARPQIEERLREEGIRARYVRGIRVTDADTLDCVKESVGRVRTQIEALLSMELPNSPMANAELRVAGGNFITARPVGVVDGVDLLHTGEVRKIEVAPLRARLEQGEVVLLSPIGYSPTGEAFNLTLEDVASASALALGADKLVFLMDTQGMTDDKGTLCRELTADEAEVLAANSGDGLASDIALYLPHCLRACRGGVGRAHLVSRHVNGALLLELFTDAGIGTMITQGPLQEMRRAGIGDVGGILQLIEPLEEEGILVRRGRELLEREIDRFVVVEHDHRIVGCAALYPFASERAGELACLAVRPDFRDRGLGGQLLRYVEDRAREAGLGKLFVLTTRAAHWFIEHGFEETEVDRLPKRRKALYNLQRRSKVFLKPL